MECQNVSRFVKPATVGTEKYHGKPQKYQEGYPAWSGSIALPVYAISALNSHAGNTST